MTIQQYIENINRLYRQGNATEHTFRGDLQVLIQSIVPAVTATNEPKRIKCGAPDYVITKTDSKVPVGYVEAKDIGLDLEDKAHQEQFTRYKKALPNIVFTNYLNFRFYRGETFLYAVEIAKIEKGSVVACTENFADFEMKIKNFSSVISQTITSPTDLAELMAEKAKFMAVQIQQALQADLEAKTETELSIQFEGFQKMLVPDLNAKSFADMYAQTIAYGMFAARYHDPTIDTFSRQEAATLIPISNPFLRKLFQQIAGYDLDVRINYLVDDLVQIFLASDVKEIMRNFGKSTQQQDPVIHFYETFLAKYDPALRKARGVWYTPQAVVNFIVRAVDDILKTEFGLSKGLADSSKIKLPITENGQQVEKEFHKVQILDPAVGTGTFLAEVVNQIHQKFAKQQGMWKQYVERELIPRLNGFELLMTSYAMAHLKMDILLSELGFKNENQQRFRIFLTNSLQEATSNEYNTFVQWLSSESREANKVKVDTPVMVVLGNPPYSVSSSNKGEWIQNLVADYKKNLNERNMQPLSDDYIKFIRYGQHFVDKNGSGILAYISNNSFLDGIIHGQMRKSLLESFDCIYILDLHGNARKKEIALDGSPDQNVFDIMQGVSINIFVKTAKKQKGELSSVFHFGLKGKREMKYDFLNENSLKSIKWNKLKYNKNSYYFIEKDFDKGDEYEKGFKIEIIMPQKSSGVKTHDDGNLVGDKIDIIKKALERKNIIVDSSLFKEYAYRPFDNGYVYYDTKILGRAREKTVYHLMYDNIGLILVSQPQAANLNYFDCIFASNKISDTNMFRRGGPLIFPLYLYPYDKKGQMQLGEEETRRPNLQMEIVSQIAAGLGLRFTPEKTTETGTFAPIDILDYIYAVLHSPAYRETYKEFLKIDFPRVPYPQEEGSFWELVRLGGELRALHLLESEKVDDYITGYPQDGDNVVRKTPKYKDGNVYINDNQYFEGVPEVAWNFYIGGYQPAQKWLKDRKDRTLDIDDLLHYQKIIVALCETDRIMQEIDAVGVM
jgi:predicted helicase